MDQQLAGAIASVASAIQANHNIGWCIVGGILVAAGIWFYRYVRKQY